jgi:hypothetical protein
MGCSTDTAKPIEGAPSASARKPLDRLAPGELMPGTAEAFGFIAPKQLRLERRFPGEAHFVGQASAEAVANYVRERVSVERVEVGVARTVFPKVIIKGGDPNKHYRIEVVRDGPLSRIMIRDITVPAAPEGLSEEERWTRAGMRPDGKPLDPKKLQ